jgi:hypothetical protein
MGQNKSEVPAGFKKRTIILYVNAADITSTTNPVVRYITPVGLTPLAFRITPYSEFDFTTGNETLVMSVEDDTVAISTANTTLAAANKALIAEATFAASTHVAKDSVLEFIVTLGGTTPIIPAGSVFAFDYLED